MSHNNPTKKDNLNFSENTHCLKTLQEHKKKQTMTLHKIQNKIASKEGVAGGHTY